VTPVEAHGVTRVFGSFTAVDTVHLEVAAGQVVGLLGANGAGKTTLIRMLLGLETATSGRTRLFGEAPSREQRRRVGYVPQNLGLYPDLTVGENLGFHARVFGTGSDGEASVADDAPIGLVGRLPLGAQRRAAFAAASRHRPPLLILDEPTSGVSPLARSRQWDLVRQHAEAGVAVLVSTHHMEEAVQADRLVVMAHGRVVARGRPDEVVGDRRIIEVRADRWADAFAALDRDGLHLTLDGRTLRVLSGTVADVETRLQQAGVPAEVGTVAATLDETMVELSV
jgi:ABC-2 type transport system ATP-binding protein